MDSIGETKARLLRGAVQDNIATVRGVRIVHPKPQARRRSGVWIFSALSAIALVYLTVPAQFVPSRASVQSTTPVSAAAISVDLTPEATVPLSHPRPIDRSAIPLSIKTIVIDPGHGGEPGATAESGLTEKEITLDVALRLRRILGQSPFEVLLTRETDRRLSLDQRVAFANEHKADLFLSIHVNSMEPHTSSPAGRIKSRIIPSRTTKKSSKRFMSTPGATNHAFLPGPFKADFFSRSRSLIPIWKIAASGPRPSSF